MKKVNYFIFSLICLFSCSIVFAKDEISVEKMIPVYDENSGVIVAEENGEHSVIFNDKNQSIKYNVVLENTSDKDLTVESINLTTPTEDFLVYELDGLKSKDILKANDTKEVVVSLETIKKEGWGRNFNDELIATINFDNPVTSPNTSTNALIVILILATFITVSIIVVSRKNKVARYMVLILVLGSTTIISAKETITVPIKVNAKFESQNVMKPAKDENGVFVDFWEPQFKNSDYELASIKCIYFENEIKEKEEYDYKFDVSENGDGKVIAYLVEDGKKEIEIILPDFVLTEEIPLYDLYIQANGIIYANENASHYFSDMPSLLNIYNIEYFDTSNVTNMSNMFDGTGNENENFTLDLSSFDTSNVTNMSYMFYGTGEASTNFTLDLSSFDTSKVTDMKYMFGYTGYNSTNFTLDLSNFDTSNVIDMGSMFSFTGYNSTNFTLDLSSFDTSNVTDMGSMFSFTGYNSTNFTLDLSNFDTSNVKYMSGMFNGTGYSNPNFTLDVSNFDTSNVTDMGYMFSFTGYNSTNFTLDLSNFDTSNVTDMSRMFYQAGYSNPNFTLDVSNFDTSDVTHMGNMFYQAGYSNPNFTLDVSNFDTSNVTSMSGMFYQAGYSNPNFTLDVSNFDTSNVTDMSRMFYQAGYSNPNFTLDVSNFDTSNVKYMSGMFNGTGYNSTKFITSITIKNPKTTSYSTMFRDVATKNGSQITVNYTSETSELVDKMIATKSDGSNVVKGIQVD